MVARRETRSFNENRHGDEDIYQAKFSRVTFGERKNLASITRLVTKFMKTRVTATCHRRDLIRGYGIAICRGEFQIRRHLEKKLKDRYDGETIEILTRQTQRLFRLAVRIDELYASCQLGNFNYIG